MHNEVSGGNGWQEECGVFGIWAPDEPISELCYLGLFSLQHRGQESAGIAVTNGMHIDVEKGMGLMPEVFRDRIPELKGHCGIGHVRYSTVGASLQSNIQPIFAYFSGGFLSLAHNGSLTNAKKVREDLEKAGCVFQTTMDTEVILNLIARSGKESIQDKIIESLENIEGAYCLTIMTGDKLIGVRDAYGFRPLCIGKIGNGFVIASESCALDAVGAEFLRDVLPGEIVVIDENGMTSFFLPQKRPSKLCVFEYIYFARPDSTIDGISVWQARYRMGQRLAKEFPLDADIVIPVPDTGIAAAIGLAAESGIPYKEGLIKNRYIGRTFILPDQSKRDAMVKMKLNPIRATLEGQRVILVDDSIVRGTTSAKLISLLREAGAKEVHMCVSSPPITHPCYYGIDTSIRKELIAATYSIEEIRQQIGADSLNYLSPEGLLRAVCDEGEEILCSACFSGKYPTDVSECEEEGHKLEFGKD